MPDWEADFSIISPFDRAKLLTHHFTSLTWLIIQHVFNLNTGKEKYYFDLLTVLFFQTNMITKKNTLAFDAFSGIFKALLATATWRRLNLITGLYIFLCFWKADVVKQCKRLSGTLYGFTYQNGFELIWPLSGSLNLNWLLDKKICLFLHPNPVNKTLRYEKELL